MTTELLAYYARKRERDSALCTPDTDEADSAEAWRAEQAMLNRLGVL